MLFVFITANRWGLRKAQMVKHMNEETIIDNKGANRKHQQPKVENQPTEKVNAKANPTPEPKSQKNTKDSKKVIGATAGIAGAAGLAAGILTPIQAFPQNSDNLDAVGEGETDLSTGSHHAGYELEVATGVDDSMTFSEAFAAARKEVGAGGIFVWHGHTYGTYYADEWNAMSPDDKDQYWANVSHTTSHLNNSEPQNVTSGEDPVNDPTGEEPVAEPIVEPHGNVPTDPPGGWDPNDPNDPNEIPAVPVGEPVEYDLNGDEISDMSIVDINANGVPDIQIDTTGDGHFDTTLMDVSITGASEVITDDGVASCLEPIEDTVFDDNPDVDVLASNDMDTIVPVDNNMDMGEYV